MICLILIMSSYYSTEQYVVPMVESSQNESIIAMDVTDYNMDPNNSFSPPKPLSALPTLPLTPSKDDLNASLQHENEALRQRVNRLTQIEDYSIHLKTRVEDLERQLEQRTSDESTNYQRNLSQVRYINNNNNNNNS